jgi:hypothetical protein
MSKNNRNTDRIKTNFNVKMSRASSQGNRFIEAKLINISSGGCKLKMENIQTGFAVGEPITITFHLADFEISSPGNLKVDAEVRWAYPDGSEVGCQFKEMDAKSLVLFNNILASKAFKPDS